MALSEEFIAAVNSGNVLRTRIMLKDSLLIDKSFKTYYEMLDYAKNMKGKMYGENKTLFDDKLEPDDLIYDKSKWTEDYMNEQMVEVVNNFNKQRLKHLQEVVKYIFQDNKNQSNENMKIIEEIKKNIESISKYISKKIQNLI